MYAYDEIFTEETFAIFARYSYIIELITVAQYVPKIYNH